MTNDRRTNALLLSLKLISELLDNINPGEAGARHLLEVAVAEAKEALRADSLRQPRTESDGR